MIRRAAVLLLLFATACSSMHYDLDGVRVPVRADAAEGSAGEPFVLESKYVMYVHGLLGHKQPKVAELMQAHCEGASSVTEFRVSATTSLWDWLGTHLSLGFVRLKTVRIHGKLHR